MEKTRLKILLIVLILALLILTFVTIKYQGFIIKDNNQEEITIGFILPLSGDAAVLGEVERRAADLAVKEINSQGGVSGKELRIIYEDGKCNGKDAVSAAYKLINIDNTDFLMSFCSSETLAVAPIAEENKKVLITAWASNSDISSAGDYTFRSAITDKATAELTAETMFKDYKKVGIISELTSYCTGLREGFKNKFESLEGDVVSEDYMQGEKDVRLQITKILSKNIDAIYVNPDTPTTGAAILKQLRELGFNKQIYGNFFAGSPEIQQMPQAEGLIFFADPYIKDNPIKNHFYKAYNKKYGENPSFEYPALSRYDDIYILVKAIENVGLNSTDVKNYLYGNEFIGSLGTYRFDENGDITGVSPGIKQILNGKAVFI